MNNVIKSPIMLGHVLLGTLLHGSDERVAFSYSTVKDGIIYDEMKTFSSMIEFVNYTKKELGISKKVISLALIKTGDFV